MTYKVKGNFVRHGKKGERTAFSTGNSIEPTKLELKYYPDSFVLETDEDGGKGGGYESKDFSETYDVENPPQSDDDNSVRQRGRRNKDEI